MNFGFPILIERATADLYSVGSPFV